MQHPDEGIIHAWLDGALSDEESRAIELHVAECEECASAVAKARGLIAASSRIVSALDIVPGGVIPAAKPQRAAWYTSTQLRAAAAVVIIAGASLLVMRNGRQEAVMQASRPMIAAAPATAPATPALAEVEKPIEVDKAVSQSAPLITLKAKKVASTAETGARRENSQREVAADQIAPAAPPPTPTAAAASEIRADAARAAEPQRALFGKVSGVVATTADSSELRPVRGDTTAAVRRTVYQVSTNLEVTLVESSPPPAGASVSAKVAEGRVAQRTAAAPPPPVANAPRDVAVNSISWISKLGRVMTLSGPVSKEELQALRLRLPAEKQ